MKTGNPGESRDHTITWSFPGIFDDKRGDLYSVGILAA